MSDIKHICIITYGYPHEKMPYFYTFVDKLVCAIADQGIKCTVINPVGKKIGHSHLMPPTSWTKKTKNGSVIELFCPRYLYFYATKVGGFNTGVLTFHLFMKAVKNTIKKYNLKPDCLYAHFIFPAGAAAAVVGNEIKLPVYFAYGESTSWGVEVLGKSRLKKYFKGINGVVAVSSAKKEELLGFNLISEEKIEVFPNAVDDTVFFPRQKSEMRKKYGFSSSDFIVGFTGNFNESKGVMRLLEAVKTNENIKLVLIGGGKDRPESNNIIFKGFLPHDEVPLMLSTCDVFVLPTLNEGCSNAIIEAMACGLPIISADRSFNYDILDKTNAILVDPENVKEIRNAIIKLMESVELRKQLSEKSFQKSKKLSIEKRAFDILKWMNL
ncbi:MAG: glycosyltransferase family 4 protein [Acetobacterium sp.]|uniref:glycosyltransferase family 4 protein n=1 Tax=Acetobacterium sp. TaxID=1872094 RepID=UPI0032426105